MALEEQRLPAGPRRDLAIALRQLHGDAGKPSARRIAEAVNGADDYPDTVSHTTVSTMLSDKGAGSRWTMWESVVRQLAAWSTPSLDPDDQAARFKQLWDAAHESAAAQEPLVSPATGALSQAANRADHGQQADDDDTRENIGVSGSFPCILPGQLTVEGSQPSQPGRMDKPSRNPMRRHNSRWALIAIVLLIAAGIVTYAMRSHQNAERLVADSTTAVRIPVKSLSPSLAAMLGRGVLTAKPTIAGFVFKVEAGSGNLCLKANTTGFMAGQDGDPTALWNCNSADSEIWIPVQWDKYHQGPTWLVNYEYESKCLNADDIGGLANGHAVQLWNCYYSPNESWDFGDWYNRPDRALNPYPLLLSSGAFCLDADKYYISMGNGDPVHIWTCYGAPNQKWS